MLTRRQKLNRFYRKNVKVKKKHKLHAWFTDEYDQIRDFYINCPEDCVVDHIIPINGKNVSGLHTLSNLQYLPYKENLLKRNYFEDFQGWTKEYEQEYMREYAKRNAEQLSEYRKNYRETPENKEKAREYAKQYYKKRKTEDVM